MYFQRYVVDEFCTDIDLNTVKSIEQQSPESGIKLIKVIDTFKCSTRFLTDGHDVPDMGTLFRMEKNRIQVGNIPHQGESLSLSPHHQMSSI